MEIIWFDNLNSFTVFFTEGIIYLKMFMCRFL